VPLYTTVFWKNILEIFSKKNFKFFYKKSLKNLYTILLRFFKNILPKICHFQSFLNPFTSAFTT
jgi:hypothetical protein